MNITLKHMDLYFLIKNQVEKEEDIPGIIIKSPASQKRLNKAYDSFLISQEKDGHVEIDLDKNIKLTDKIKPYIYNIVNAKIEIVRITQGYALAREPFSETAFISDIGVTFVKIKLNEYDMTVCEINESKKINETFTRYFKLENFNYSNHNTLILPANDAEALLSDYDEGNNEKLEIYADKSNVSLDELKNLIKSAYTDSNTQIINVYRHTENKINPEAITIKALLSYGLLYKVIYKKSGDLLCIESVTSANEIFIKCMDFKEEN